MRRIRFRPNQTFFLNVDGKIEQYKFVKATYTYNGSVAIIVKPKESPTLLMTLLAENGYVRREFKKVEKGGTYGDCCIFSGFDRSRNIVMWSAIYFSRRTAKKGKSVTELWKQPSHDIKADSMSRAGADIEAMMKLVRVVTKGPIDAMLIDDLTGKRERVTFQPSVKLKDILNTAVTTASTHPDVKLPTYDDLKVMAEKLAEAKESVHLRNASYWPLFEIRKPRDIINLKGGV